jgi:hypothetical protein
MSVHRLVGSGILPAEQPQRGLPRVISTADLDLPEVQRAVLSLKAGHTRPLPEDPRQLKFFKTPFFPVFLDLAPKECIMLDRLKRELQRTPARLAPLQGRFL